MVPGENRKEWQPSRNRKAEINVELPTPDITKTSSSPKKCFRPKEIITTLHKQIRCLEKEVTNLRKEKEKKYGVIKS